MARRAVARSANRVSVARSRALSRSPAAAAATVAARSGSTPSATSRSITACNGTGYKGRIAFLEILSVDTGVKAALLAKVEEDQVRRIARDAGLRPLREDGLVKARQGITSLEEVLRTTPTDLFREEEVVREATREAGDTYSP